MKNKNLLSALTLLSLISLNIIILSLSASAFTTERGNEIVLSWGIMERTRLNYTPQWIPYINHGNGTIVTGHFEMVFRNLYKKKIPYIDGIFFNGKYLPKGFFTYKINQRASIFSVPIGDRNLKEFGECRPYEIRKGVCKLR